MRNIGRRVEEAISRSSLSGRRCYSTADYHDKKARYTALQSRTVGQEQYCKNCSKFKDITDQGTEELTDQRTDGPMDRHGKV